MEPIEVILSALAAGAITGATDVAGTAIKDAYKALVSLVTKKFGSNKEAKSHLDNYLKDSETWEKPVKKAIQESKIDKDDQVIALAHELLKLVKSNKASSENHIEINGNVQGLIQENKGQVTMNFSKPPATKRKVLKKKGK
ncbi:MAG: hypothetical protein IPO22_23590 [Anaerolineales bacterium]|nr:hypothetical protein [Anaerolineales bacterium]